MNKRQQAIVDRTRATFYQAKLILEHRGLAHGDAVDVAGRVCASHALFEASQMITRNKPFMTSARAEAFVERHLLRTGPNAGNIAGWNDEKKNGRYVRTRKQAIALFDKAIKQLEAEPEKLFEVYD